jgi:chromosome partitioning protein
VASTRPGPLEVADSSVGPAVAPEASGGHHDGHETAEHALLVPEESEVRPEPARRSVQDLSVASGDSEGDPALEHTGEPVVTEDRPVRELPRVIAVANQKGGVGKTTTTVNLGASLALFGFRILIVDLDPQGNATTGLGVDARGFQHSMYDVLLNDTPMVDCIEPVGIENLFVAPATLDLAGVEQELFSALSRELRLKRALSTVVEDYDFVFIDCPPSLGLITINAFAAASEILVPVQCEYYALEGLTQLQRIVTLVQRNLNEDLEISTVVLTMYDGRTRLSEDVANEVRKHFPTQTQGTVIPRTVRLSEAPSFGQPITTFDPASKGARAYKALAREVSDGAQKRAG